MKRPLYLDYAATTPLCLPALEALYQCLGPKAAFGNPHSPHFYGCEAAHIIEKAEEGLIALLHAEENSLIWTSGATEANNLALQGAAHFYQPKGKHLITTKSEHKSVLDVFKHLETLGFEVSYLPVQKNGLLDIQTLQEALRPDTILVSVMWVNNELGTIQAIHDIARLVKANHSLFHVDAAQALGKVPIYLDSIPIDLLSLSAHKIYGPKGVGALYIRPKIKINPLFFGGDQQKKRRPGTESPALISAFSAAAQFCLHDFDKKINEVGLLRDQLWQGLFDLGGVDLNTDLLHSVPHILNVRFNQIDGESLLLALNPYMAISQGSACTSTQIQPSHVLRSIGLTHQEADSSFRFSIGHMTRSAEIEEALIHIQEVIAHLRASACSLPPHLGQPNIMMFELVDTKQGFHIHFSLSLDLENTVFLECAYSLTGSPFLKQGLEWLKNRLLLKPIQALLILKEQDLLDELILPQNRRYSVKIIGKLIEKMQKALNIPQGE